MRRLLMVLGCAVLVTAFAAPAELYAQQSANFYIGGFNPKGEDTRLRGDVLVNNLDFFRFELSDFTSVTIGGEWLFALNDRSEVGFGIGLSSKTVPSAFRNLMNEDTGEDIRQDLKLRIVPITATYRFLPAGRNASLQPYLGIGLGVLAWRYTETGEFIDFDGFIFRDRFASSGTSAGAVYLGGLRVPLGDWDLGGEVRYQAAHGDVDPVDFAGATRVDLGGFSYLATFNVRF
jgi:hypothetical protein